MSFATCCVTWNRYRSVIVDVFGQLTYLGNKNLGAKTCRIVTLIVIREGIQDCLIWFIVIKYRLIMWELSYNPHLILCIQVANELFLNIQLQLRKMCRSVVTILKVCLRCNVWTCWYLSCSLQSPFPVDNTMRTATYYVHVVLVLRLGGRWLQAKGPASDTFVFEQPPTCWK